MYTFCMKLQIFLGVHEQFDLTELETCYYASVENIQYNNSQYNNCCNIPRSLQILTKLKIFVSELFR